MTLLADRRFEAARRSGGTSAVGIKAFVLRLLGERGLGGSVLDFGAGLGELVRLLREQPAFTEVAGIDLYPRPDELPDDVAWHQQDLNEPVDLGRRFDVVVCSEVIEHLENPRHVFRTLAALVRPGGTLVLTMPNQECIRSLVGLVFRGHFTQFLAECYPAHVTALLRLDLVRLCAETGFAPPGFYFTGEGAVPRLTRLSWQRVSFGLLRGRWFSDNLGMVTTLSC
jgi:SAM-dependent methyltransferase